MIVEQILIAASLLGHNVQDAERPLLQYFTIYAFPVIGVAMIYLYLTMKLAYSGYQFAKTDSRRNAALWFLFTFLMLGVGRIMSHVFFFFYDLYPWIAIWHWVTFLVASFTVLRYGHQITLELAEGHQVHVDMEQIYQAKTKDELAEAIEETCARLTTGISVREGSHVVHWTARIPRCSIIDTKEKRCTGPAVGRIVDPGYKVFVCEHHLIVAEANGFPCKALKQKYGKNNDPAQ